jgi:hypothetical protein
MANVFFGDGLFPLAEGNWNNVANWFSSQGYYDDGDISGTPLGRLPTETDVVHLCCPVTSNTPASWSGNVVLLATASGGLVGKISSGSWAGNITGGSYSGDNASEIAGGTFSGTVVVGNIKISGGTFNNSVTLANGSICIVTGGIFNAAVNLAVNAFIFTGSGSGENRLTGGTFNGTATINGLKITGGSFNGLFSANAPSGAATLSNGTLALAPFTRIAGGTYSPVATVAIIKSGGVWTLDTSTIPTDPGFRRGGGTFSPIITLAGLPDILGAGL